MYDIVKNINNIELVLNFNTDYLNSLKDKKYFDKKNYRLSVSLSFIINDLEYHYPGIHFA